MNQRFLRATRACIFCFLVLGLFCCGSKKEKNQSIDPGQLENTTPSSSAAPSNPQAPSGGATNDGKISAIELAKRIFNRADIGNASNPGGADGLYGYLADYEKNVRDGTKLDVHAGMDFRAKPEGIHAVYSLVTGKVKKAEDGGGFGTFSVYSLSKNATFIYLHLDHLDRSAPKVGECITQGQIIGYAGKRPDFEPHLHIEVRKGDKNNGLGGESCGGRCTKWQVEELTYDPRAIDSLAGDGSSQCTSQPNDNQNANTQSSSAGSAQIVNISTSVPSTQTTSGGNSQASSATSTSSASTTASGAGNMQTENNSSAQSTSATNNQTTTSSASSTNTVSNSSQTSNASNQTGTPQPATTTTQIARTVTIISGKVLLGYIRCDATTPAVFRVTSSINGNSDISVVIDKPDGSGLKKPGKADLKKWGNSASTTISSTGYSQGGKPSFIVPSNALSTSASNQFGIVLTSDDGTSSCTPDWVTIKIN